MSDVKLCKACKWYNANALGMSEEYDQCMSPQNVKAVSMVRGTSVRKWNYCENARVCDSGCGLAAKWFEAAQ